MYSTYIQYIVQYRTKTLISVEPRKETSEVRDLAKPKDEENNAKQQQTSFISRRRFTPSISRNKYRLNTIKTEPDKDKTEVKGHDPHDLEDISPTPSLSSTKFSPEINHNDEVQLMSSIENIDSGR